jgi:phasin family protein
MAESTDKAVKSAEDAYAAVAAEAKPAKSETAEVGDSPAALDQPTTSEASAEAPAAVKAAAPKPKPAARKAAVERTRKPAIMKPVAKTSRKISKPRRLPAPKPKAIAASTPRFTVTELKEKIMATAKTTDFTKPFADAISDAQSKAKTAFDKSAALAAEATEFAKGNVEAIVESTKVYAAGVQDLGKTYAAEAKSAFETLTGDIKELAAVKSPAELFQLQAKLARRNFDALVAYSSKNTDAVSKLATEAFAPISGRISLAAEKISKAA